jgi:hypothetical protein
MRRGTPRLSEQNQSLDEEIGKIPEQLRFILSGKSLYRVSLAPHAAIINLTRIIHEPVWNGFSYKPDILSKLA